MMPCDAEHCQQADSVLMGEIFRAAAVVRRALLPGRTANTILRNLRAELERRGIEVHQDVPMDVMCRGVLVKDAVRLGLIVDGRIVVDVQTPNHDVAAQEARMRTCLVLSGCSTGMIIDFCGDAAGYESRRISIGARVEPAREQVREERLFAQR